MTAILEETAPVVEDTVEVEVISIVEMGRIVHMLRGEERWTSSVSGYGYRTKKSNGRRFTDEQLRHVLGLTTKELDEYQAAYRESLRNWDRTQLVAAVVAFAKREKRWPNMKDFADDPALPASSTWSMWGGQRELDYVWLRTAKNVRSLHPQLLLGIRNIEARQRAIEAAGGIERLIRRGGATKLQHDKYGTLWEMPPEPGIVEKKAVWLEVANATAEPDGKRERFFLRVPPTMETAKAAVEWSFSIPPGELEEFAAET